MLELLQRLNGKDILLALLGDFFGARFDQIFEQDLYDRNKRYVINADKIYGSRSQIGYTLKLCKRAASFCRGRSVVSISSA